VFDNIRHPQKRAMLAAYTETANISRSAAAAEIDRTTHYVWMREDADYRAAFESAKEIAVDSLEDEAIRRAKDGLLKPVYQGGKLVGHIQEYSDTLMIFLLKGARPEKYRERFDTHLSGKDGGPVEMNVNREQLLGRISSLAARTGTTGADRKPE
jgi:hypothetical protein